MTSRTLSNGVTISMGDVLNIGSPYAFYDGVHHTLFMFAITLTWGNIVIYNKVKAHIVNEYNMLKLLRSDHSPS